MGKCICPKCKSNNVIPIMYGYPSWEVIQAAEKGEIKLGGCEILIDGGEMPDRYCKDCECEWSRDDFLVEDIVKVRFRYWSNWGCFDPESTEEAQWAFDILPDGAVAYSSYPRASRRVLDKDKVTISKQRVLDFYQNIIWLYRPWTVIEECQVCDGDSYELTITYADKRKRTFHGDVGGGTVDKTVMDFLCSISEIKEKIEGVED